MHCAKDRYYWKNFYECFYPPKKKTPQVTGPTREHVSLDFPNDAPTNIPIEVINNTISDGEKLPNTDAGHWDQERKDWFNSGDVLKRRIAIGDWWWKWYKHTLKPKRISLTLPLALKKDQFDKFLHSKLGDKFEDDTMIILTRKDPDRTIIESMFNTEFKVDICGVKIQFTD